ncbi:MULTISPECIES: T9SS type A sorting domain-containing protein [unclassified Lacinutrix]
MKQLLLYFTLTVLTIQSTFSQVPANDLIQNATLVDQSPHVERNVRIDQASVGDGGQNGCELGVNYQQIYYKFTATNTNIISITIEDSREGYTLGNAFAIVYSASDLNATSDSQLTNISPCTYAGETTFTPTVGTNYYVIIHRTNGESNYTSITIDIPQAVTPSEKTALQDLYNNTNGATWTNQNNWNTTNPESSWHGVTVKNGHVSKLLLNANNLNGTIPASILNLPYLEEINFSNNGISGTFPDIGTITTINSVNISNNDFSFSDLETNYASNNTIASFIYQTQNKRDTEDSFDGITGNSYTLTMNPISGTNVQYQWYKKRFNYFNASDDAIPGATGNTYSITNLQDQNFDVYFCRATSASVPYLVIERNSIEIKGEVSQLQKDALIAIYISTNGGSWNDNTNWLSAEPVSDWYGVTVTGNKVSKLEFSNNNLTGTLPPEIGDLTGLEYLSFYSGNSINGTLPPEVGNLTELRVLSFEYNNFTGPIPASYANLTELRGFWFNNNQLSGEVPDFIATNYPNMVYFDISYNNFQGILPDFTALQYLKYININNNHFYASDFSDQFNDYITQANWNSSWYYSPQTTLDTPGSQNLNTGNDITLSVSETAGRFSSRTSSSPVFQWYKDNLIISGADTNPYIITNAQPSDSGSYHCVITDNDIPNFEIIRAPILVDVALSINENELKKVQIYPIPTKSMLYISSNRIVNFIEIFDLLGKKIKHIEKPSNKIDLSNFSPGVYILKLQTENKTVSKRIIKN